MKNQGRRAEGSASVNPRCFFVDFCTPLIFGTLSMLERDFVVLWLCEAGSKGLTLPKILSLGTGLLRVVAGFQ